MRVRARGSLRVVSARPERSEAGPLHLVEDLPSPAWARATSPRTVRLLDLDPGLFAGLAPEQRVAAGRCAVAPVVDLGTGEWQPHELEGGADGLGALVLDGVILRQVSLGDRHAAELIGPGDLIRPADADEGRQAPIPYETTWFAVRHTRVALLDARFARAAGRWPSILDVVFSRTTARARSATVLLAISQLGGLDLRLLALLWHLADRFGHVERDGVVIPIRLTHEVMSRLVGARRPPVTMAINRLKRRGLVRRAPEGGWMLLGRPPVELSGELLLGADPIGAPLA